jgi:hypothetical protein
MGKRGGTGADEDSLLDVGFHRQDVCDEAEQPGQDAHFRRADSQDDWHQGKTQQFILVLSGECTWDSEYQSAGNGFVCFAGAAEAVRQLHCTTWR